MTARRIATDDKHYIHVQVTSASSWVVNHNLAKVPAVIVIDSAGSVVEGDVVHNSINQLVLSFSSPFAGEAFCN